MKQFTYEQLTNNIYLVDQMTIEEIDDFFERYKGKRFPFRQLRDILWERRKILVQEQTIEARADNIEHRAIALWHRVKDLWKIPETQDKMYRYHARGIGTTIFDFPVVWSGYDSIEAYKVRCKQNYKPCPEHFYPRQWAGERLLTKIINLKDQFSFTEFLHDLCEFCHVHNVTSQENQELIKYQQTDTFVSPPYSYKQAGIELIHVQDVDTSHPWGLVLERNT